MQQRWDSTIDAPRPTLRVGASPVDTDASGIDRLLEEAWRCAAGRGPITVIDPAVRDAWEVRELEGLDDPHWCAALQRALDEAADVLRFGGPVEPRFDKLVLYGPDGHFAGHRDTIRDDGHVGSLVVRLRSADAGGRLWVGEETPQPDPAAPSDGWACTVFHADVLHRIEPVDEGWRVTLVYSVHRAAPARALSDEPDDGSKIPDPPTGSVEGGEVALLRHRYCARALEAGALVGEDRALLARWRTEDPTARIEVGVLSGRVFEYWEREQETWVTPVHRVGGADVHAPCAVACGAKMAAAVERYAQPGAFYRWWTGNEGHQSAFRYRAGAVVRWPGKPRGHHPTTAHCLQIVRDEVPKRVERLARLLATVQSQLDGLQSGTWLRGLEESLAGLDPKSAVEAIGRAVCTWDDLVWPVISGESGELAGLIEGNLDLADALHRAGLAELAKQAVDEGWTAPDEDVWLHGPPELFARTEQLTLTKLHGEQRVALGQAPALRRLHIESGAWNPSQGKALPRLPLLEVLEVAEQHMSGFELDLSEMPALRSLTFGGLVRGRSDRLVRADIRADDGRVPSGVASSTLRSLRLTSHEGTSEVEALRRATRLRRLVLEELVDLHGIDWDRLEHLRHLELRDRRRHDQPLLRLPAAAQPVLERLEHLTLRGCDLGAVDLSSCHRLRALHLERCTNVEARPPGGLLRALSLERTTMNWPNELPRLESLRLVHATWPARSEPPPRLRELHVEASAELDLSGWAEAPNLRALALVNVGDLRLSADGVFPELEQLRLERVDALERVPWGPRLRAVSMSDTPLVQALPDPPAPELARLSLEFLAELKRLPGWITDCPLEALEVCSCGLEQLPVLSGFTELHTLHLWGCEVPVDDGFAENLHSAPALNCVQLVPPEPDPSHGFSFEEQLQAAGHVAPEPEDRGQRELAQLAYDDDEEDIPF